MEKKNREVLFFSVLICLLPMVLGIVLYNKLPEQMPIHFTINDVPDNYAPKNFALFGIPTIMAIMQALMIFMIEKKIKNNDKPKIIKIMEWFIPIITVLIYIIMVKFVLESNVYVGKCVCLILGILFMIIGNYLPKVNYEIGKTMIHPTPKDEKSFRKMNRMMGYSFICLGLLFLIMIIWV